MSRRVSRWSASSSRQPFLFRKRAPPKKEKPMKIRIPKHFAYLICIAISLSACQKDALPASVRLETARQAVEQGRYPEALSEMRLLVKEHPDDARLQRYYGEALIASGQPSLAIWPLQRATRDDREQLPAGILLAGALMQGGSGADAIRVATQVLEVDPSNTNALLLRVRALLSENLEERALADLDQARELGVEESATELLRLEALLGLRREEEAEALLSTLHETALREIDSDPSRAAGLCAATAKFAEEKGEPGEAAERFEACLEGPGLRNGLLVRSAITFYDERGDFERATDIFERRFREDESSPVRRVAYARRLQRVGEGDRAEQLLLDVAKEQPSIWSALVDHYVLRSEFKKALSALDKSLALSPQTPDGWQLSRADFLVILGRYDEAEKMLDEIDTPSYRTLIEARIAMGRDELEVAAERFEEGIRLWPDNADARYLAGHTYERLGNFAKAASHYREAARMNPPHYDSSFALAEIQRALGDREGTGFVLLRLGEAHPTDPDVLEQLIEFASATQNETMGRNLYVRLASLEGMEARAVAHSASIAYRANAPIGGPEGALKVIQKSQIETVLPKNFDALSAQIEYLNELGRVQESLALVESALALSPKNSRLAALRGTVHLAAGRLDEATRDIEAALEKAPRSHFATLSLARVRVAQENLPEARMLYLKAIALENDQQSRKASAALALADLEVSAMRPREAEGVLRKILEKSPRNGEAAFRLARLLHKHDGKKSEISDMAWRAAFFERSIESLEFYRQVAPNGGAAT